MSNPLKKIEIDNKKALLIIAIALLFVYLDYAFVLKLQLRNLKNSGPNIQKLKNDLSDLSLQLARMQEAKAKQQQTKQDALAKAKKFIREEEIPSLLEDISGAAKENNIELIQIKPLHRRQAALNTREAAAEKFNPILISLSLSCGYHELVRFLSNLEGREVFIAVEELEVSARQKDYLKHKVTLTLKAYAEKKP